MAMRNEEMKTANGVGICGLSVFRSFGFTALSEDCGHSAALGVCIFCHGLGVGENRNDKGIGPVCHERDEGRGRAVCRPAG